MTEVTTSTFAPCGESGGELREFSEPSIANANGSLPSAKNGDAKARKVIKINGEFWTGEIARIDVASSFRKTFLFVVPSVGEECAVSLNPLLLRDKIVTSRFAKKL
ncbi:MAG: hypothetical protein RMM16_10150 [Chloroherpetonaceae bacterium]|nr:hypothetical protein [Chloroherpetonaceae bacterium]